MLEKTQSVRLYRAGSPDEGEGFWTPNQAYARQVHPDAAIHEAILLEGFVQKTFECLRLGMVLDGEVKDREADILVFTAPDGIEKEYVLLNPQAVTILK